MRLLVSGATATLRRIAQTDSDVLGCLPTPHTGNDPKALESLGLPMAADNGCFTDLDSEKFVLMLNDFREAGVKLDWVAVPDVVADGEATFARWGKWEPVVQAFGFKPALVLQDGMTRLDVHQLNPPAVFVGGSDEFKDGPIAEAIVRDWREKGRPAHMGRVSTDWRTRWAVEIGCTSIDTSGCSKWPDVMIPKMIRFIRRALKRKAMKQGTLY